MSKLIKKIAMGLIIVSIISMNFEKGVFADSNDYYLQEVEDSILNHLENWDTSFNIDYYNKDALDLVREVSRKDDYLNMSITRLEYIGNGKESTINVTYRTTSEEENKIDDELESVINSIITPDMSDADKVKTINKYLVDRYEYDYTLVSNNAYKALTTGKTTCQGYAMTAYKMFKLAGVENKIITGTLNGVAHGWNLVKVNGNWYHIDITNNDSTNDINRFLLKSDSDLIKEGFVWEYDDYPKCPANYDDELKDLDSNVYWYEESGSWYLMTESGQNATGWNYIDGQWYYLGNDGKMQIGWIYDSGNWYYCRSNGAMAINTIIDGYAVDSNGVWIK